MKNTTTRLNRLFRLAGVGLLTLLPALGIPAQAAESLDHRLTQEDMKTHQPTQEPEVIGPAYFGEKFEDRLLNLGTTEKFEKIERDLIKDQVKTFIPPLLVPTIGNHAFVLPPGLFQVATSFVFTNLTGTDFFKKGEVNPVDVAKGTRRQFLTTSIRYGFDLDMKYLHSFTAILNIPYQNANSTGPVHQRVNSPISGYVPDGDINVHNPGNANGLGDVSFFIKKKLWDQANYPLGIAIGMGVFFPTGSDNEKVGADGCITAERLTPESERKALGPALGTGGCGPGRVRFGRFHPDGRFPTVLQPGKGSFSFQIGAFGTRQFIPGDLPNFLAGTPFDRAVVHFGGFHRFNHASDGIDSGDLSVAFLTALFPFYKDYLSLQFGNVNFFQQADSYSGMFTFPGTGCTINAAGDPRTDITPNSGVNCGAVPRPSFSKGWTSLVGPGLIFSPDPIVRITLTTMFRVKAPELGPAPRFVVNIGTAFVF